MRSVSDLNAKDLQRFVRSGGQDMGYPTVLIMSDGEVIDAQSARENYRSIRMAMRNDDKRSSWHPYAVDAHWEGEPLVCAHSGRMIESAYGVPE